MKAASPVSVSVASLISNAPSPVFMVGAERAPINDPVPKVNRLPLLSTVSWFSGPTERRLLGVVLPMPTFPPRSSISSGEASSNEILAVALPSPRKPVSAKNRELPGAPIVNASPLMILPTVVMSPTPPIPLPVVHSHLTLLSFHIST